MSLITKQSYEMDPPKRMTFDDVRGADRDPAIFTVKSSDFLTEMWANNKKLLTSR